MRARKRGEKCAMQHCSMPHARSVLGTATCRVSSRRSPGAKKSHIHGIYGGIALLEHLRTMTMHLGALLRARRAIRVMHLNAPSDSLFLSQFLRIVTQRRPVVRSFKRGSHCARRKKNRSEKDHVRSTRKIFRFQAACLRNYANAPQQEILRLASDEKLIFPTF